MITCSYSMADQHFERGKSLGILNVSRGLLGQLARNPEVGRLTVFLNRSLDGLLDIPEHAVVEYHDGAIRNRWRRILWDQWGAYRAAKTTGNEWLLLSKGFASFVRPCPVKLAAVVYDTMQDHNQQVYPDAVSKQEQWYFASSFRATLKYANVILTISEFTTSEVRRMASKLGLPCPPVITMGIGFTAPPVSAGVKEERVLFLCGPYPHKRTGAAIDFLERWRMQSGFKGVFDCVGHLPKGVALPIASQWRHHGRLSDSAYQDLQKRAKVVLFVSDYEGFGMPPVEAALAGACPVYSRIPATCEVMAGAGCAFDNNDFASFAAAMEQALIAPAAQIAAWRDELLGRHNWAKVQEVVVSALKRY